MALSDWPLRYEESIDDGWIRSIEWGPNDEFLYVMLTGTNETRVLDATKSDYPTVTSWDENRYPFQTHASPDNSYIARCSSGDTVYINSIGSADGTGWTEAAQLSPGPTRFLETAWAPDGSELALAGENGEIYIYTTGNWSSPARTFDYTAYSAIGGSPSILGMEWSQDDQYLAIGHSKDEPVIVIDAQDGTEVIQYSTTGSALSDVSFRPNSSELIFTDDDRIVLVDVGNPDGTGWSITNEYTVPGGDTAWDADWRRLDNIVAVGDRTEPGGGVDIYETASPYDHQLEIPSNNTAVEQVEFSSDDSKLAYGDQNGILRIRSTPERENSEVTISATIPTNTSCTVYFYEDTEGDGTADVSDSISVVDGTNTYIIGISGRQSYDHWITVDMENDSDVTTAGPEIQSIELDTFNLAGSMIRAPNGGVLDTDSGSLVTDI